MDIYKSGLSDTEVVARRKQSGFNELPAKNNSHPLKIIVSILSEPMILLLVFGGIIYLFLGELKDSLVLLLSVLVVIGTTYYQERKTEHALEALRDLSSPRAMVIRNGQPQRIAGREVVVDDLIMLEEGDRVPADADIISAQNLLIDESLLTGESLPVPKSPQNKVFSGTLIVQGSGVAQVTAIGAATQMGQIGKSLQTITDEDSLLKN